MGLWLLQESLRTWDAGGHAPRTSPTLLAAAALLPGGRPVIDPDDAGVPRAGRHAGADRGRAAPDRGTRRPSDAGRASSAASSTASPRRSPGPSTTRGAPVRPATRGRPPRRRRRRNALLCQLTADACRLARRRRAGRGDGDRQRARPGPGARARLGRPAGRCARSRVAPSPCGGSSRRSRRWAADVRVALFITCFNDVLSPDVGQAIGPAPRAARPRGRLSRGADLLRPDALQHRLPGRVRAAGPARSPTRSQRYDVVVTPSASCASMVRHHHATVAAHAADDRRSSRHVAARRAARLRAERVPRRRARRDRRRRRLPAPGGVPPDLPLGPAARDRRSAAPTARGRRGPRARRPAGRRPVLRVRRDVRGQERGHVGGDGRGQGRRRRGDRRRRC